jgi:hypothetical protein
MATRNDTGVLTPAVKVGGELVIDAIAWTEPPGTTAWRPKIVTPTSAAGEQIKLVQVVWHEPDGTHFVLPMIRKSAAHWQLKIKVADKMTVGGRSCMLRAITYAGELAHTAPCHIHVMSS